MRIALFFIVFLLVSFGILLLCAYKILQWFKRENVAGKWQAFRAQQQQHELYALRQRIERLRVVNLLVFFVLICVLVPLAKVWLDESWYAALPVVLIGLAFWLNNRIVSSLWRCTVCRQELPRILGRTSLRPKIVGNCPHCGHSYVVKKKPDNGFFQ